MIMLTPIAQLKRRRIGVSRRGFTLLEFLVYLLVISALLTAAVGLAIEFTAAQAKNFARQEVERNGRYALARVALEIREASDVNWGDSVFGAAIGRVSLAMTDVGVNPTVLYLDAGRLYAQRGSGPALPITGTNVVVDSFQIDNVTAPNITKSFRLNLELHYAGDNGWFAADDVFRTTVQVKRGHGFN